MGFDHLTFPNGGAFELSVGDQISTLSHPPSQGGMVGHAIDRCITRLHRFTLIVGLVVLVLSNIITAKACLLICSNKYLILTDIENDLYSILLAKQHDTPSEDMIVGFGCFSAVC